MTYVAPEILRGQPYDEAVDMWSVGIIIYVALVGYPPFLEENRERQCQKICAAEYQFYNEDWGNISLYAQDLLRKLLVVDPNQRLSASQAMQHDWVTEKHQEFTQGSSPATNFVAL